MSQRSKKRKIESEDQIINFEHDNLFCNEVKDEIETMWEIPQIFHFLYLAKESLNIPQLSLYEMERMLLIPRASKQLANIMTCLLSSPITKAKLRKVPSMPYEFWTNILAHKMASWFKIYHAKHKDAAKVLEIIGVEPEFWSIFPDASLTDDKAFEDLSFKQRIWLLKTICDTIMHTRKTVQEDIAKQPWQDQFETVLGIDRHGSRYIYFPQFISTDLRIYKQCLDNKILSTVKPRTKQTNLETKNLIDKKFSRYTKRKSQFHNSLSRRSSRRTSIIENKDFNNYKCNNDSATGSFISEDTNLSSTSTCSNSNNITLDAIHIKRSRSLSKMSEESILSNETRSSNAKSSGYDTNTSSDNKSFDEEPAEMFKGFPNTNNDNHNIEIITEILNNLKSDIDKEKGRNGSNSRISNNNELVSQENPVRLCKNVTNSYTEIPTDKDQLRDEIETVSSKTDDEKLNEIISAENSKLPEIIHPKNVSTSDNISDISSRSKSDDEKLNETKTSNIKTNSAKNSLDKDISCTELLCVTSSQNFENSRERISKSNAQAVLNVLLSNENPGIKRNLKKKIKLRSCYRTKQHNKNSKIEAVIIDEDDTEDNKINDTNDKNFIVSNTELEEEILDEDLDDYTNNSDTGYNLRKSRDLKEDESKQHFNKMLSDLSVSDFQLVADSVDGLRDLISRFPTDLENNNINIAETPLCEIRLANNLRDLLSSVEKTETILKDMMRKARSKLQREWSNFKEGSVEDQDSSGEGGLSSNWWILGSQGCPMSTPGDATLQTLPQSTLSSPGAQNQQLQSKNLHEKQIKNSAQSQCNSHKNNGSRNSEKSNIEAQGGQETEKEEQKNKHKQLKKTETTSNNEDAEQQTRRVLRTRGVSSYTEQFYSDDESDENELEEWTDVEAVYAAPGAQTDTSASHTNPKVRHVDDRSEKEDSDQDWILPSSRKRKNKRSSTNRRLKSSQHKLQNVKENTSHNNIVTSVPHLANARSDKDKSKNDREIVELDMEMNDSPQISGVINKSSTASNVPCTKTNSKVEVAASVHSELDIKDEGPIYDSVSNYNQNNYNPNSEQNYVMIKTDSNSMNYYVMPQNPTNIISPGSLVQTGAIVSGIMPPIQQGYYLQRAQNYIVGNARPNCISTQQQPVLQNPQMVAQPFVNNAGYMPYMVTTAQPTARYVITSAPSVSNLSSPQNPIQCTSKPQDRLNQKNKYTTPRQNSSNPNGAMVKSTPIKSSSQRPLIPKPLKSNVSQQHTPNSKIVSKRGQTPQTSTENVGQKTTSLIVLSDSDDEIEMIITEKINTKKDAPVGNDRARSVPQRDLISRQKPTITSDVTISTTKSTISPQIIQRMSQGGISITPVKSNTAPSMNTQLVVVVNETGSHYALALPNGSKLILTPEQVAQIRASNGGKLIL